MDEQVRERERKKERENKAKGKTKGKKGLEREEKTDKIKRTVLGPVTAEGLFRLDMLGQPIVRITR